MCSGAIHAGIAASLDWGIDWEAPCSNMPPSGLGTKGSKGIVLDSVGLKTMALATHLHLLGRDGPHRCRRIWLGHGSLEKVI